MCPSTSSGLKVASAAITLLPSQLTALTVTGGAGGVVTVYDNALGDTSGLVLAKLTVAATSQGELIFNSPIIANKGLSVQISGVTDYICYFILGS
jgi:hypothetical protein